ncbi:hypothetical protein D9758_008903 [Tetrapyrgos nigripes]|uniref:DNA repair protein rhp7 treble clef domain-containing protein n=1 Tax=Tetrapyrgos nigripes TaxID=182062 RepID=A0A8H5FP87_9AGAR|nr:hypothetical protein D9758_008903 [Tetrapyrgos nigripes]
MSRNNVRGPTSALTEFLRSSGITPTTVARRAATRNQDEPVAGPSNQAENEPVQDAEEPEPEPESRSGRRRRRNAATSGYASDELDEPETPAKKQKTTAKAKAKAKKAAKKDEDAEDEEEDTYTALSKSILPTRPPIGNLEECAKCQTKFPVTKYTLAANPGPGWLCHKCAKSAGMDPFKKPAPRKRAKPTEKRNVAYFEERRFPSLVSICINIVSKHIDDIEAFGDIGALNMESISKAISRNRSLTSENVHLFYGAENTFLTLYDTTKLSPDAFVTLGHLNPNLTTLRLDFCGTLNDAVLGSWSTSFPSLQSLELLGPFLVRVPAWISFFQSHPQLQSFLITQSPRFDLECIQTLVETSQGSLQRLRLKEVGQMSDAFLEHIAQLSGQLTYLDISDPTESCTEDAIVTLLSVVGSTLAHLDLSGHVELTDQVLHLGIKKNVANLDGLVLSNIPELTDAGVSEFFSTWGCTPLSVLDMSRNPSLATGALDAILNHSGPALRDLNINGWKDVEDSALEKVGKAAFELRKLDWSWCRDVNDFAMKELLDHCKGLQEVKVWGCNKVEGKWVSNGTRTKARVLGVESHTAI